jgi:hypothetical protein
MSNDINSRTIGGTMTYLDWVVEKGYGTPAQITPWKGALKQVFDTVEGEDYASFDWTEVDLNDYLDRFQRIAGGNYKTESIAAYGRRVHNALESHKHYLETGRAPASKPRAPRRKAEPSVAATNGNNVTPISAASSAGSTQPGMVTFPYPLDDGQLATLILPRRLSSGDATRMATLIRTLVDETPERRQLPVGHEDDEQHNAA